MEVVDQDNNENVAENTEVLVDEASPADALVDESSKAASSNHAHAAGTELNVQETMSSSVDAALLQNAVAAPDLAGEDAINDEVTPALLEALFIASGTGLTMDELCATTGLKSDALDPLLELLASRYANDSSGIELRKVAGRYQVRTKEQYAEVIRKLKTDTPRRLSAQALETLAIVAYRQPVLRSEVEKLRGVDVGPTIKTLLERGLIRIVGTQPTPGSPALFGTTEEFLKVFGLASLEELPSIRDLHEISKEPSEQAAA